MIGKTLVHYEITAEIGKGGMGEVYQAKDTKLGRDVAIKVLPEEFALDTDRVARFQREAKLLASLNHPNIAAIYGLEESEGTHFLVMELIEGDTLRDRIKSGPIPVEEALNLALQMAEALEAAHEKGVIHRDLKPANIKVTPDGMVKILDFGLAKAYTGDQDKINLADSPTISVAATQQGVILGTAAYMSPEQAKGKPVDKRADIWAFGCVLYEMLTGRQLFTGETASETLASVMKSEPEWDNLPPNLHSRIRFLLERCLEKQPKDRYSGISDARVDIHKVLADPSGLFVQTITAARPRKKLRFGIPWLAGALVLGGIIVGVVAWRLKPTEPRQVMRFYHELPEDQTFTQTAASVVDLSADGTKIVYVANRQLYLRNLNELTARPIQGTDENSTTPFFSPDGLWVGYYSPNDRQWKKITVSGGAPVILCDAGLPAGATWGSDNTILFEEDIGGIKRVSGNGGTPELLIEEKEGKRFHGPQALPGGEWVLFSISGKSTDSWDDAQIVAQSLKTGERRILVSGGSDARYIPTGHLVYALGDVLYAKAFDVDRIEVVGGAVPIVEGVQRAGFTGSANYGVSDTGMLAYVVGSAATAIRRSLVWVDRNGEEEPLEAESSSYQEPRISPDGTKVALTIDNGDKSDIWIWDVVNKNMPRLTFNENSDYPLWTLDGQRIAFMSGDERAVYWRAADGTGNDELIGSGPGLGTIPYAWSVEGKTLVTTVWAGGTNINIGSISMEGDHPYKPLLQEEYREFQPQISPDGKWMAYASNESGNREIYVRPFPDVDKGRWQVSKDGGDSPLWSPDGKELFYRKNDEVIAVSVETEPIFKTVKSETLFQKNYVSRTLILHPNPWDIHPDGKRFLMMKESTGDETTKETSRPTINIIANWFEELKQRVPVD
jgi:serine/threonine protein kinase/Tol biopolymer transport system component